MDDLDAPQWADFMAHSPQISYDDYFIRRHDKHEYREKSETIDSDSPNLSILKPNQNKQSLNEISYESILQKTPITIVKSKMKKNSSSKANNAKETTYENVLMEAMNNLQLSVKKSANEKSFNKPCLIDSPAFKTPSRRITRLMCAQMVNTSKHNLEVSHCESAQEKLVKVMEHLDNEENKENICSEQCESVTNENSFVIRKNNFENHNSLIMKENNEDNESLRNKQTLQLHLEVVHPESSTEHKISCEKLGLELESHKEIQNNQFKINTQLPRSKVVTSFASEQNIPEIGSNKNVTTLTGNAWHRQVKRCTSIINKQLSLSKPSSNKIMSKLEASIKFQQGTSRFLKTNIKTKRTEQLRRVSYKLTRAVSPALKCKNRTRPTTAISRDEKERLELEKIRQNQIKANPVPKDILKKPASLKKVEKKMITNPEPFNLTNSKKGQPLLKTVQETRRIHRTKTVPLIIDTDDKRVFVKNEEVLYYGIPCKTKLKSTKVIPFSFEARNKELQMKKQEKLKIMQEKEQQNLKAEFHARPVPIAVKTPVKPVQKENCLKKPKITLARSLSFEDRYKQVQKKKEEKIKQMLEEEKRARTFKAQKVPEFKPVIIRGRSRDNLLKNSQEYLAVKSHNISCNDKKSISLKRSQENLVAKQTNFIKKPMAIPNVAHKKTSPSSISTENQENRNQGAVPKILEPKCKLSQKSVSVLTELNTVKQVNKSNEFNEDLKKKEIRKQAERRIAKERAEKLELRKMTEIKARPMPVYKPMTIVKSNKPLTAAQSPAWAKRKGSIH